MLYLTQSAQKARLARIVRVPAAAHLTATPVTASPAHVSAWEQTEARLPKKRRIDVREIHCREPLLRYHFHYCSSLIYNFIFEMYNRMTNDL